MNAIITLLTYWSIALGLLAGGLYALNRGFSLVMSARGKTKEDSRVEFLGLKVTVGSIGALVMITAFMWGWAAKLALPNYKDAEITISALKEKIEETQGVVARLQRKITEKEVVLAQVQAQFDQIYVTTAATHSEKDDEIVFLKQKIVSLHDHLKSLQSTASLPDNNRLFAFAYTDSVNVITNDYHCGNDCSGQQQIPTEELMLTTTEDRAILINPNVQCEGEGCSFVEISEPRLSSDNRSVLVKYKVRGKAVTLTLHADVFLSKITE